MIEALFQGKLIAQESLNEMKNLIDGMGAGLIYFPFYERSALGHNGGIDGFLSNLSFFEDKQLAVAITANGMNFNFNEILIGILSICFNRPFDFPDFDKKKIGLSADDLKLFVGSFHSDQFPLDITIKETNGKLFGQATGQPEFPLTPFSKIEFRFENAGIKIQFDQTNDSNINYDSFKFNQHGQKFQYQRR